MQPVETPHEREIGVRQRSRKGPENSKPGLTRRYIVSEPSLILMIELLVVLYSSVELHSSEYSGAYFGSETCPCDYE
ncbi:hypothetical protein [Bradyrhizobium yuanmingense]|uniref:hypothetical protein n=1 Tax=Bradyrhizobium yuanmingense TaxID=108015 RepID=UPI0023BA158B|nr:hypothetical protein [Bradyrhizobium yuanmingense]MDF0497205.1 hypothetical protein [Bradyrhizobium yuanmingense]